MKIRIHDDSVRCRLGRRELADLLATEFLVATTHFPTGKLRFGLSLDAEVGAPLVDCVDGLVGIGLPMRAFTNWARGNEESYAFSVPLAVGTLNVLIEKDFPCDTRNDCAVSDDLFSPQSLNLD